MKPRGTQKIAAALLALDREVAAQLLEELPDGPLEELSLAMQQLSGESDFDPEDAGAALDEFWQRLRRKRPASEFQHLLQQALGERAQPHIERWVESRDARSPFEALEILPPQEVAEALSEESLQAAALALAALRPHFAARILEHCAPERRAELLRRIATTETPGPELQERVAKAILDRLGPVRPSPVPRAPSEGLGRAASIMNHLPQETEDQLEHSLREQDEALYTELDRRRVTLEDLVTLDKRSMQRLLSELDTQALVLALKDVPRSVEQAILGNVSKRARHTLLEERDLLGTVPRVEVEQAQQQILLKVRQLVRDGELLLQREGGHGLVD